MKNKKRLLIAVAAMGLVAAATAGVGTAAWFQTSSATAAINKDAGITGSITVNDPDVELEDLAAKITFSVALSDSTIGLSTWDSSTMKTGILPDTVASDANASTIAANFRSETVDSPYTGYVGIYAVTAVLSDDSTAEEKLAAGHDAQWKSAVYAQRTVAKHVQFTCTTVGDSDDMGADEVFFYCAASNTTYAKANEGVSGTSGKTQGLGCTVEDLITISEGAMTGVKAAQTIGYLYVRLEGSLRVHTGTSYAVTLTATATDGAAAANA